MRDDDMWAGGINRIKVVTTEGELRRLNGVLMETVATGESSIVTLFWL